MIKEHFQKMASVQGSAFHNECIRVLRMAGFEIADQHVTLGEIGIEIDCITNNAHGIAMPWEFKGSWNGDRPGLLRTDTLKKAIANGYLLSRWDLAGSMTPLLVMTSHIPTDGSPGAMLANVERRIILGVFDSRIQKPLRWLQNATAEEIERLMRNSPTCATPTS